KGATGKEKFRVFFKDANNITVEPQVWTKQLTALKGWDAVKIPLKALKDSGLDLSKLTQVGFSYGANEGNAEKATIHVAALQFINGDKVLPVSLICGRIAAEGNVRRFPNLNNDPDLYSNERFYDPSMHWNIRSCYVTNGRNEAIEIQDALGKDKNNKLIHRIWSVWPGTTYITVHKEDGKPDYTIYLEGSFKDNYVNVWRERNYLNSLGDSSYSVFEDSAAYPEAGKEAGDLRMIFQNQSLPNGHTIVWAKDMVNDMVHTFVYDQNGICRWKKDTSYLFGGRLAPSYSYVYDETGLPYRKQSPSNSSEWYGIAIRMFSKNEFAREANIALSRDWSVLEKEIKPYVEARKASHKHVKVDTSFTPPVHTQIGMSDKGLTLSVDPSKAATVAESTAWAKDSADRLNKITGIVLIGVGAAIVTVVLTGIWAAIDYKNKIRNKALAPSIVIIKITALFAAILKAIKDILKIRSLDAVAVQVISDREHKIAKSTWEMGSNYAFVRWLAEHGADQNTADTYRDFWFNFLKYMNNLINSGRSRRITLQYEDFDVLYEILNRNVAPTPSLNISAEAITLAWSIFGVEIDFNGTSFPLHEEDNNIERIRAATELVSLLDGVYGSSQSLDVSTKLKQIAEVNKRRGKADFAEKAADLLKAERLVRHVGRTTHNALADQASDILGDIPFKQLTTQELERILTAYEIFIRQNTNEITGLRQEILRLEKEVLVKNTVSLLQFVIKHEYRYGIFSKISGLVVSIGVGGLPALRSVFFWLATGVLWLAWNVWNIKVLLVGVVPYIAMLAVGTISAKIVAGAFALIIVGYFVAFYILSIMSIGYLTQGAVSGLIGWRDNMGAARKLSNIGTRLQKKYRTAVYATKIDGSDLMYVDYLKAEYNNMIESMRKGGLLSVDEHQAILLTDNESIEALDNKGLGALKAPRAKERIKFWAASLLRRSGVPQAVEYEMMPSLTQLPYCSNLPRYNCIWAESDIPVAYPGNPDSDLKIMGITDIQDMGHTVLYQNTIGYREEWEILVERLREEGLIADAIAERLWNLSPTDQLAGIDNEVVRQRIIEWVSNRMQTLQKTFKELVEGRDGFRNHFMRLGYSEEDAERMAREIYQVLIPIDSDGHAKINAYPELYADLVRWVAEGRATFHEIDYGNSIVNWDVGSPKATALAAVLPQIDTDVVNFFDGDTEIRAEDAAKLVNAVSEFAFDPDLAIITFRQYISNLSYNLQTRIAGHAINSWWGGNLRAKLGIGSVGFYGHNALLNVRYLKQFFGMQPDLVSEDLITACVMRLAGKKVVYRDYLQLGEGMETNLNQYSDTTGKWSAGAKELMRSRMFWRYMFSFNIPISEKIDTLFGLGHYWNTNRYMVAANVLFTLGSIVFGIAAYNVLPWHFAFLGIFFSVIINVFMIGDLAHMRGIFGSLWSWLKYFLLGNPDFKFRKTQSVQFLSKLVHLNFKQAYYVYPENRHWVPLGGFLYWVALHTTQSAGVDQGAREKAKWFTAAKGPGLDPLPRSILSKKFKWAFWLAGIMLPLIIATIALSALPIVAQSGIIASPVFGFLMELIIKPFSPKLYLALVLYILFFGAILMAPFVFNSKSPAGTFGWWTLAIFGFGVTLLGLFYLVPVASVVVLLPLLVLAAGMIIKGTWTYWRYDRINISIAGLSLVLLTALLTNNVAWFLVGPHMLLWLVPLAIIILNKLLVITDNLAEAIVDRLISKDTYRNIYGGLKGKLSSLVNRHHPKDGPLDNGGAVINAKDPLKEIPSYWLSGNFIKEIAISFSYGILGVFAEMFYILLTIFGLAHGTLLKFSFLPIALVLIALKSSVFCNIPKKELEYRLGYVEGSENIGFLRRILSNLDLDIRYRISAAWRLGVLRDERAVGDLIKLLEDKDERLRQVVSFALCDIRSNDAISPLIKMLIDPVDKVRDGAFYALERLGVLTTELKASKYLVDLRHARESDRSRCAMDYIRVVGIPEENLANRQLLQDLAVSGDIRVEENLLLLDLPIFMPLIQILRQKSITTEHLVRHAAPAAREAIDKYLSAEKREEAMKMIVDMALRIRRDANIPACSTIQYGVPLAAEAAQGNLEWFKQNLQALEDLAVELGAQEINPFETLYCGVRMIRAYSNTLDNFRRALKVAKLIPLWIKKIATAGREKYQAFPSDSAPIFDMVKETIANLSSGTNDLRLFENIVRSEIVILDASTISDDLYTERHHRWTEEVTVFVGGKCPIGYNTAITEDVERHEISYIYVPSFHSILQSSKPEEVEQNLRAWVEKVRREQGTTPAAA
ncbi:MAG: HEAT repeat domain-containing protein, partial [Candidatus Omnitrophota bacterium]